MKKNIVKNYSKTTTVGALAASALALGACSTDNAEQTESSNGGGETVTVTEDSTSTEDAGKEESKSEGATASQEADSSSQARFDVAAISAALTDLGYNCQDEDCTKEDAGIHYDLDLDNDSISGNVSERENGADVAGAFDTILGDLGTVIGDYDFGDADWNEIETWVKDNNTDPESKTELGNARVESESGMDDNRPERSFDLELARA